MELSVRCNKSLSTRALLKAKQNDTHIKCVSPRKYKQTIHIYANTIVLHSYKRDPSPIDPTKKLPVSFSVLSPRWSIESCLQIMQSTMQRSNLLQFNIELSARTLRTRNNTTGDTSTNTKSIQIRGGGQTHRINC